MVHRMVMLTAFFTGCISNTLLRASSDEKFFNLSPKGTIYIKGIEPEDITTEIDTSKISSFSVVAVNQEIEIIDLKTALIICHRTIDPTRRILKSGSTMKVIFLRDEDSIPVASCCSIS